jgi:hypothetical protein
MGPARVRTTKSVAEFAAHVMRFVEARPVEHNVLATALRALRDGDIDADQPVFAWVQDEGERCRISRSAPAPARLDDDRSGR